MIFVDRVEETSRIEGALAGDKPALVVVYGRRRLGKSTLIKRVLSDNDVYFLADRSEGQHQRALLARIFAMLAETLSASSSSLSLGVRTVLL